MTVLKTTNRTTKLGQLWLKASSKLPSFSNLIISMSRYFLLSFFKAALFLCLITNNSHAIEASDYLIEDVDVNVVGKSPSQARDLAVATARRDAFLILLSRLENSVTIADNISDEEISDMVRSEQIDKEVIAGNRYSATFNIMFAKNFVDHILAKKQAKNTKAKEESGSKFWGEKIANSSNQKELQLLIPVKIVKGRPMVWEEENDWRQAIAKNFSKAAKQRFVIPEANMENIATLNHDNIKRIGFQELEPVMQRYNASSAYILFFDYSDLKKKVEISVVYLRRLQNKKTRLSFVNIEHLNSEILLNKVAEKTVNYLLSVNSPEDKSLNSNLIHIGIPIRTLNDWLTIKNKFESSNLINKMNIESLSKDYALISVNYVDAVVKIDEAFAKIGIYLDQKSENFYIVR
jgi:hypothetical protein